jgi:hypothetical protein
LVKEEAIDLGISGGVTADPEIEFVALMRDLIHTSRHAPDRNDKFTIGSLGNHPLV